MNAYMVYSGCPSDWAVLAFAHTAREARKIGYPALKDFDYDLCYTDVQARRMSLNPTIEAERQGDQPHVIESPRICPSCERWGGDIGEQDCSSCREVEAEG